MKKYVICSIYSFVIVLTFLHSRLSFAGELAPNPDLSIFDTKVDPCENFYQYACGGWIAQNSIPSDMPSWDRSFSSITEQNQTLLKDVLEKYSQGSKQPANPYTQKLGDFYGSCMDESQIEAQSMKVLKAGLSEIEMLQQHGKKYENLEVLLAWLHLREINVLFSFGNTQDLKHPQMNIAEINQGGMGLPSKEYYFDNGAKMKIIRNQYVEHVQKMLVLSGENEKKAAVQAQQILALETSLAKAALAPEEMRDPTKLYHIVNFQTLQKQSPNFQWKSYVEALGLKPMDSTNLTVPAYWKRVNEVVGETPLPQLKNYFRYKLIVGSSKALPERFAQQSFEFYGKTLYGIQSLPPRWKRCVRATNESMGFALGRAYVDLKFVGESKVVARDMMEKIEAEQAKLLESLPWMDSVTKVAAQQKLKNLINQVGYPDRWRNYDNLKTDRNSYLANRYEGLVFNNRYELAKIGTALDRTDWGMSPSQVNAYNDSSQGKMVFPAGILQPPFFHSTYTQSANFAGIGMVMGHELSHSFDDEGRQFDANGAMADWWSAKSAEEFKKRAQCLSDQYDSYPAEGGGHVNGKLTLGEDIGDQGGLKLSYFAWKNTVPKEVAANEEAFRKEQKNFFLSFAQSWCGKSSEAFEQILIKTNPHPPMRYRVIGAASNLPAFAQAFQCKPGSKMAPTQRCEVW